MNRKPLLHRLTHKKRHRLEKKFEQCVLNAEGQQYDNELAGLTKADIVSNNSLRQFWIYWHESVPSYDVAKHGLEFLPELATKRLELASQRLNSITFRLWKLAQYDESEVPAGLEKISKVQTSLSGSRLGKVSKGIEHLRAAAVCLGYRPDHFYRSVRVNSIRRLEGESDAEHELRISAVESYRLIQTYDYVDSDRQKPSLQTFALRNIWPLLDIDVATLKLLFLTEKGAHRHGAAIRSILRMSSSDFDLPTGSIDKFLESQSTRT